MLFNTLEYFLFLPIVAVLFFALRQRYRWIFLLGASYYFYASWNIKYSLFIILSTLIAYFTALAVAKTRDRSQRKLYLWICLISNLGFLFVFKYFNFFNESLRTLLGRFDLLYAIPDFKLLLPIGISYYTFQVLSYILDVYRGKIQPERHLGIFALYLVFFPKLVAGPIERADKLIPQFHQTQKFNIDQTISGLKLIGWGLFKKVVIADRLAIAVNTVYNNPQAYDGIALLTATLFFTFQIYCDFSAYTDMAIGSARIMGFSLSPNFERPYYAKSIREFWSRWHITLSSWLRDYIYIPLGGNRVRVSRHYFNILVTFLASGLWHGANWTFVLWGGLHGVYQIIGHMTKDFRLRICQGLGLDHVPRLKQLIQIAITFGLVSFAWIFFRADSLTDGLYIASHLFSGISHWTSLAYVKTKICALGLSKFELVVAMFSLVIMEIVHLYQRNERTLESFARKPLLIRWAFYYLIIFMIIVLGVNDSASQFIYVQF